MPLGQICGGKCGEKPPLGQIAAVQYGHRPPDGQIAAVQWGYPPSPTDCSRAMALPPSLHII